MNNTMQAIQPIETRYQGYRFRSRLEARWAVFFDALGLRWEYEKEGFDLGELGGYLPDFWLPQVVSFAEVKPRPFTEREYARCIALVMGTRTSCILLDSSEPQNRPYFEIDGYTLDYGLPLHYQTPTFYEVYQDFYDSPQGFRYAFPSVCLTMYHNYPIDERRFYGSPGCASDGHYLDTEKAVIAARSARFEFGENGR